MENNEVMMPLSNEDKRQDSTSSEQTTTTTGTQEKQRLPVRWKLGIFTVASLAIVIFAGYYSFYLWGVAVTDATLTAKDTFVATKESVSETTYQRFYNDAFNRAEKKYHVSNRAAITIGDLREESKLEVLQVSDVEYITYDEDDTHAWLEVTGNAVYTVDLSIAEYLIDSERSVVRVRLPKPILGEPWVDSINKLLMVESDDGGSGISQIIPFFGKNSAGQGSVLAQQQIGEGKQKIQSALLSNQSFYQYAEKSAETIITNLIKDVNPDTPNLSVCVEFYA